MQYMGNEVFFDRDDLIVSKTDLKGKITYANHIFLDIAGFKATEVFGQPHNMIRNPNMPRAIFELLWTTIAKGNELFAYVVNATKNGDHYWVIAHVTPSTENGKICGYHSTRRVPSSQTIKTIIEPLYDQLKAIEDKNSSSKTGIQESLAALDGILSDKGTNYSKFMASLMEDD